MGVLIRLHRFNHILRVAGETDTDGGPHPGPGGMVWHAPPLRRSPDAGGRRHCLNDGFRCERRRAACKPLFAELLVVRPHPNDLDVLDFVENLIHKSVLDVDSTGTCAREISH